MMRPNHVVKGKLRSYNIKENTQFLILCNPPKSGTSRVCIIFPQKAKKVPTKGIINWLELITEILSLLQIFGVKKNQHSAYLIFQKICKKVNKKTIFLHSLDL